MLPASGGERRAGPSVAGLTTALRRTGLPISVSLQYRAGTFAARTESRAESRASAIADLAAESGRADDHRAAELGTWAITCSARKYRRRFSSIVDAMLARYQ